MLIEPTTSMTDDALDALRTTGKVAVGSGDLRWNCGSLAIHSEFGPAGQDKDTNQDFVLAWTPNEVDSPVDWAVAMADGVTSSFLAEAAARAACCAGLAALLDGSRNWRERADQAIAAAGCAIGEIADGILADRDRFRPESEFDATWRFMLREGRFLQTTLSLAWSADNRLNVAIIGDGGVLTDGFGAATTEVTELVDDATNRVHALGPNNRTPADFDFIDSISLQGSGVVALFTDGIGRGIMHRPAELFEVYRSERLRAQGQTARLSVQKLMNRRSADFEDNLTLAFMEYDYPLANNQEATPCRSPH